MTFADLPLDPELAPWAKMFPILDLADPSAARALATRHAAQMPRYEPEIPLEIDEQLLPGLRDADPPVKVVAYRRRDAAQSASLVPAIVDMHAGAYVLGGPEVSFREAARFAEMGAFVVSVDYRLAPEHPYPNALDDCYASLVWLATEAESLGVDPERIAISGTSAGGGLCAALALRARDEGGPQICFQRLSISEIDDRLQTPSMLRFDDLPSWSGYNARLSWRYYLGPNLEPGSADVPVYAAAARATDLSGLPPAFINVCEFDPLRDEDLTYGLRLAQAGVPTEMHLYPGTFHGSTMIESAGITARMVRDDEAAMARALGLPIRTDCSE